MGTKKITLFSSIFLFNSILKGIIDMVLIPVLISEIGYLISLLTTTLIYLLVGVISVKIYDFYKVDFLFIETLKKAQYDKNQVIINSPIVNLILKWTKKNKLILKLILGLLLASQNIGLVVLYLRDGYYSYDGFVGKNIKLFFFLYSLAMSLYWNTFVFTTIQTIKAIR